MEDGTATLENVLVVSKSRDTLQPNNFTPRYNTHSAKKLVTNIRSSITHKMNIEQNVATPKDSSTNERINKMSYIHNSRILFSYKKGQSTDII